MFGGDAEIYLMKKQMWTKQISGGHSSESKEMLGSMFSPQVSFAASASTGEPSIFETEGDDKEAPDPKRPKEIIFVPKVRQPGKATQYSKSVHC